MSDSVPEYYRHLTDKTGEESGSEHGTDPKEDSGDEEPDSQDAPSKPTVYRADAFRLLRPKGEWQDSSVYTLTGPTIDGVPHNITVNIDEKVEPDSVYDSPAQELDLVSRFWDRNRRRPGDQRARPNAAIEIFRSTRPSRGGSGRT